MKRWEISDDLGVTWLGEVTPRLGVKFSWDRDLDSGMIFKRKKLTADLEFTGADFQTFRVWEEVAEHRCDELYIRQQRKCGSTWRTLWTGRFSASSGRWDYDKCKFTVRPEVVDRYTCLLDQMERKVNVMDVPPILVRASIFPSNMEFGFCWDLTCDNLDDGTNTWELAGSGTICTIESYTFFWRERVTTNCVDGTPVPPFGTGWVLLEDNCAIDGTAIYVRPPTVAWAFGVPTTIESPSPEPVPPSSGCATWVYMGNFPYVCDGDDIYVHVWMCPYDDIFGTEYTRGRLLRSVTEYLLEKAGCEVTEVTSDFFEWDPIGDAPGYVAGENYAVAASRPGYIPGTINPYAQPFIFQKSDVVLPGATSPAVKADLTMKQLLTWWRNGPRLYWDITDDGKFRVEHWLFYAESLGLDLTDTAEKLKLAGRMQYNHLKDEIPQYERLTFAEALNEDFVAGPVEYIGPCMTPDKTTEYTMADLTTDVSFIATEPDAISRKGFVMMATKLDGGVYRCIIDYGALSGTPVTNAPLCTANLMRDLWTWDRFLPTGIMNGEATVFDDYLPTIEHTLEAKMCNCDIADWDPMKTVRTKLGEQVLGGVLADVHRAELNDVTDILTLTLRYAY